MVPLDEVDFREDLASGEIGREIVEMWDGVGVADSALVEAPIVAAGAGGAVLLGDHVEARTPRRVRPATNARGTHQIEVLFGKAKLFWR